MYDDSFDRGPTCIWGANICDYRGDGSTVFLHILASSYIDVGQNNNTLDISVPMTEHTDLVLPNFTKIHIDLDDGIIVFEITETLDISLQIKLQH